MTRAETVAAFIQAIGREDVPAAVAMVTDDVPDHLDMIICVTQMIDLSGSE